MKPEQERAARTLASIVLDEERMSPHPGVESAAMAVIRLDMEGMIRGISKQIRFDFAAVAQTVEDELRRQCGEISIDAEIKRLVTKHVGDVLRELDKKIRDRVESHVSSAIDIHLGEYPQQLARHVMKRMIELLSEERA